MTSSEILWRKECTPLSFLFTSKCMANAGDSVKLIPFHALTVFGKTLTMVASCVTYMPDFLVVFSCCALTRLYYDAFWKHFCQHINNLVKPNYRIICVSFGKEASIPTQQWSLIAWVSFIPVLHKPWSCTLQSQFSHCCTFSMGPRQCRNFL